MQDQGERDELVMELVSTALEQAPEIRERYLRSACGDSDLYSEVEERVLWEERMEGFLTQSVMETLELLDRPFEPGELVAGRFRVLNEVGRGGMGVVYEAHDQKLDRRVALKTAVGGHDNRLPPEARAAREVSHFNVCKVYELHSTQTKLGEVEFLVMEFIEGETLSARLRRTGKLPPEQDRDIAQQICAGLAQAHRQGVVHGDLKCGNIILTETPEGGTRAVITDFGLASFKAPGEQDPDRGPLRGSFDYMAPELFLGARPSTASDLYALGVVLHEMLTGKTPAPAMDSVVAQNASTLTLPQTSPRRGVYRRCQKLPRPWRSIVARCLEVRPEDRFSSAEEIVASALAPSQRLRWAVIAAAAIIAGVLSAVVYSQIATPKDTVRLAVLPFEADSDVRALSDGLLDETSKQLRQVKGSRTRQFTVIPLADAVKNKVDRPEKASGLLGATHVLSGSIQRDSRGTRIHAYLTDAHSRFPLKEWRGAYQPEELRGLPIALAGMVTGTLRLAPLAAVATVSAAAFADFTSGVGALQRNRVDEALPLLETAVKADPNSPLTYARLAEAQILKYQLTKNVKWQQQAKASLASAELRNPDVAVVRSVSGLVNEYEGLYERAEEDYQRALELEPQSGDGWRRLGDVYQKVGRFPQAIAAYQKAVEVQPGYFKNYQALCSLYADQANFEEAIRQCQKMTGLVPQLAEARLALSKPYLAAGRYEEGERELRLAVELDAMSPKAVHALALALVYQRRYFEAIPYLKRAIEIGPESPVFYLNLGTTYRLANLQQDAKEAYSRGLTLAEAELTKNPRDRTMRSHLAYLCARLGQRSRAESEAAQAWQLSTGSIEVARMVVQTYEALGHRDRAIALAETLPDEILRRLNRSPDSSDLPKDPRFQELLRSRHIQ